MLLKIHLHPELISEPLKCLADKLGSIVVDNSLGYAYIEYVMLDEFDHV